MKYYQPLKNLLIVLFISTCFTNCSKEDIDIAENVTSMTVKLKSTSQSHDKVYFDIQDVQLKINNEEDPSSWLSLNALNTGVHDVCTLDENTPLLLVDDLEIEAHYVYEIRLVLGENNFMDINNVLHSLDVANSGNATPSNLIKSQLNPMRRYDVVIEIDVDASISQNEDENTMVLNPKIYTAIRQIEY